ncbi:MAG: hypothetical protein KDD11_18290 [Acidobacteria bacterium]|nr:hypothetical protein [Acidobacteriota bacterium]
MAIRVLSGIIQIGHGPRRGRVVIGFNPHREIDGDARIERRTEVGAEGDFTSIPVAFVGFRRLTLVEAEVIETHSVVLEDDVDRDRLVVSWRAEGNTYPEEISYLVIGDAV